MVMINELTDYYKSVNIFSCEFGCKCEESCKEGACKSLGVLRNRLNETFVQATSAYVGTKYEKPRLPRLLFVSSDPGKLEKEDQNESARTPEGVRARVEKEPLEARFVHWVWTHELAIAILAQFDSDDCELRKLHQSRPPVPKKRGVSPERRETLRTVTPYFAHVNSAKCCLNLPGTEKRLQSSIRTVATILGAR